MNLFDDIAYRKKTLLRLLDAIHRREEDIWEALRLDFGKPAFESALTETSIVISELRHTIKHLKSWAKPKMVLPHLLNFPATDYIYNEPYGRVLIIAPWNYPFLLAMSPLIAAVAAGNSVVLKPSELTSNTASIIELIITEVFDSVHVEVYQGGAEVSERLLRQRWDYIFFTGSVTVGKLVAKAAAEHLTPVTLELGGKNPCIVDETADLPLAARRIVWGKFMNAGQTCIAPDYILARASIKDKLVGLLKEEISRAYGNNPESSEDFARIINDRNFERLVGLIDPSKVAAGGQTNPQTRYIAPTIIDEPAAESVMMSEEIFGPLLPILEYHNDEQLLKMVQKHEKPLALYVFTGKKAFAEQMIQSNSFGGGCINDTVIQFSNKRLPFGGVGHSGTGAYHGKYGFDTFSHKKSIVKKGTWLDIPLRYAPYGNKVKLVNRILKWF
jgi:aldehyde dehydrogenase (NAD+)